MAKTPVTGRAMLAAMLSLIAMALTLVSQSPSPIDQPVFTWIDAQSVRICPAPDDSPEPPDFSAPDCIQGDFGDIDPQGRQIWVEARLFLNEDSLAGRGPLGLSVFAKASSAAIINDYRLEPNGRPSARPVSELAGLMDTSIYVPREVLRTGENRVYLRMSSHQGYVTLANPVHLIALGPYAPPNHAILDFYTPTLITFGAFALGFIVFGITAFRATDRLSPALLSTMSFLAGLQLFAETARGTIPYAYPMHDLRLMIITASIVLFALAFLAYLLHRFLPVKPRIKIALLATATLIAGITITNTTGFDGKSGYGFLSVMLVALSTALYCALRHDRGAWAFVAFSAAFAAALLVFTGQFLDFHFYYIAASLLLFMFWQTAQALIRERREREREGQRAAQLEVALAQARQKDAPQQIQLVSSGRVDYIATDTIAQFKGAGDYVEVHYADGRTALYNGGLSQLEHDLPPSFLRVHRSYIVNTAFVSALEREPSGIGRLLLSDGGEVPVSRRIMPKVRSALDAAPG